MMPRAQGRADRRHPRLGSVVKIVAGRRSFILDRLWRLAAAVGMALVVLLDSVDAEVEGIEKERLRAKMRR